MHPVIPFLRSINDPIVLVSPSGTIECVNASAASLLGYEEEELTGKAVRTIFLEERPEEHPGGDAKWMSGNHRKFESAFIDRDGRKIPVLVSCSVMENGQGNVQGFVWFAHDISEQKKYEGELKGSKEFIETILNSMNDGISIIDVDDFSIVGANQVFLKGVGLTERDVIGKPCYEITHHRPDPCTPPDDVCPLMETVKTGRHEVAEHIHYNKQNERFYVEVSTSPIKDEKGKVIQVVHVARDITARKQAELELAERAEALARSNRELEEFAYIASHDLQEPLRKVMTFGERLKSKYGDALTDQGRDYLERMQGATVRMQVLINDLLSFSRVTSKAQPFVPVDLARIVREVLSDLEIRIQQTGARVDAESLPTIEADPLQMRQLLQNLIGNSLRFSRKEEMPVIRISHRILPDERRIADRSSPPRNLCRIVVEDNGIGFDGKYAERIFGVFQRLHGRGEYEGTGIGLAICRKIVDRHGGRITAEGTPGQGATFTITLPVSQSKGNEDGK